MTSITPTYSSSFIPLGVPKRLPRKPADPQVFTYSSFSQPPKYPSYLKDTLYAKIVQDQYNHFQQKMNAEYNKTTILQQTKTTNQMSTALETEQYENLDLRLPTCWNAKDKSKNIEVGNNGLNLSYIGPGKQEAHAALVRSDLPMKPQCGIFYYEMKVKSKGDDGYIGIGFCAGTNKLERLPGWDPDSWGYHGDDGHSFAGSGSGKTYGPCFTTGDIIGCGVNFADKSAFYTKNGKFLGNAFTNINFTKPVFPAIGLRTPGEQVITNFGQEPFVFDIVQYITDQKLKYTKDITTCPKLESQKKKDYPKEVLDQLILSYLIHHGYTGTAKSVVQNVGHVSSQEVFLMNYGNSEASSKHMDERQMIRSAIINGRIDDAIALINRHFPGVLQEEGRGQELELCLKCEKFIELIRAYYEYSKPTNSKAKVQMKNKYTCSSISSITTSRESDYTPTTTTPSSSTSTDSNLAEIMDIEEDDSYPSNKEFNHGHLSPSYDSDDDMSIAYTLKDVMQYGQSLQEEYRHDTREKTRSSLMEVFSLLAYPDPYSSPVAYLLNISRRDALATEVNAAILAFQHLPEMPALECMYRQTALCNKELAWNGHGKAILLNIEDYCTLINKAN